MTIETKTPYSNSLKNGNAENIGQILTNVLDNGKSNIKNIDEPYKLKILKNLNFHYSDENYAPFVNGYYYIHMQTGTWADIYNKFMNKNNSTVITSSFRDGNDLQTIGDNMGKYLFQTDLPNIMMESETFSGRLRNINYATKMQVMSDFSISYKDNASLEVLGYNTAWFKYIELLRRGDIELPLDNTNNKIDYSPFMDISYYNAIWVVIFKPFSVEPIAIFKLMGVMPISLPLNSVLGDRGAPTIGLFNQSYKCNDIIFDIKKQNSTQTNTVFDKLLTEFKAVMEK